jgi:CDP-glucose 4,6-dehydratase
MANSIDGFFRGKRVLVTGHTGFKGAWLSLWLHELGASVAGFALDPPTHPNLYEIVRERVFPPAAGADDGRGDIREMSVVEEALGRFAPDVIFHLAAQPLVRLSYAEPLETLATNVMGTAHLLEAVRRRNVPCTVVVVTSDKCYENREWEFAYREHDPLGGHDVYSMSKGAAELVAAAWRHSFYQTPTCQGIRMVTARAGNVIGGGDFALDRILPDAVAALTAGKSVPVRNPHATRPWQHVLECLGGYLWLAARLALAGEGEERRRLESAFNFGPGPSANRPVSALVAEFLRHWPGGQWEDLSGRIGPQPYEAGRLNLAIDKADAMLGWFPVWTFEETVGRTAGWYHRQAAAGTEGAAPALLELCLQQIEDYTADAASRNVAWATPLPA